MHDLQRTIRRIARREKRLLLAQAMGVVVLVTVLAVTVAGLLDYYLRFEEVGLRWLATLAIAAVTGGMLWRYLRPAWSFSRGDVSTALCIERCFPGLADRLSSAVAFLQAEPNAADAGSLALRSSLVTQVSAEIERYPLDNCLSARRPWRSVALAGLALLALSVAIAANPAAAQRAALRLAMPWNELAWPRRNQLVFVDTPVHLGPGQDFEALVVDRHGRLPESVQIQYWFEGDPASAIESRDMRFAGGRMIHRLANVHRAFRYRAVGGDDDTMPWTELSLVAPPQLEQFTVRVTPPAYSQRPPYDASGPLQALVGSTLALRGRADQPLTHVMLHAQPAQALAFVSASLGSGGEATFREFHLTGSAQQPITVQESGTYWLTMTDQEGRRFSSQRWELRALADERPTVRMATISSTGAVTSSALLPLEIVARDDLRIDAIELQFTVADGQPQTTVLWQRSAEPESDAAEATSGDERRVTTDWNLQPLELEDGSTLEVRAIARDSHGQAGESLAQRLRIIGPDELDERLVQSQATLVARLAEIVRVQREAHQQATALQVHFTETEQIERAQLDQLQSAELTQRRVGQMIGDGNDSLLSQIAGLLQQFEVNQAASGPTRERLESLARNVTELQQRALPTIERALLSASKLVPRPLTAAAPVPQETIERLDDATAEQQRVIERLEALAAELGQWENYQRLVREIEQIVDEQARIEGETVAIQPDTLGRDVLDLAAATRANLKRLASRQSELARRFEHLLGRLEAKQRTLADTDPTAAQELADGLAVARRDQVAATMRASSSGLDQNRLADSLREQRHTLDALAELADTLLHRGTTDPAARQQQLEAARQQLEQLQRRQDALRAAQQQLDQQDDSPARTAEAEQLAGQQRQLGADTHRLQRRAARLRSQAAAPLDEAAREMNAAADNLASGREDASEHSQAAQAALQRAATQLEGEAGHEAQAQFRRQLAQLKTRVLQMEGQQSELLQGTLALDEVQRAQGQLSAAQLAVLEQLGNRQRELADEVELLRTTLDTSPAFSFQLEHTQQHMRAAAQRLGQTDAGQGTRDEQQAALARLQQLRTALEPPSPGDAAQPDGSSPAEGPPKGTPETQASPPVTQSIEELKLLLLAQQDLLQRTAALENRRQQQGELTAAEQEEQQRIAAEQGALAELLAQLLAAADAASAPATPPPPDADPQQLLRGLDENLIP